MFCDDPSENFLRPFLVGGEIVILEVHVFEAHLLVRPNFLKHIFHASFPVGANIRLVVQNVQQNGHPLLVMMFAALHGVFRIE